MPFQASSIIDEHLSPCLHWRVHMVFSTWKSYFAHHGSLLEQHCFPSTPVNWSLSSYRETSFLQLSQLLHFFQHRTSGCCWLPLVTPESNCLLSPVGYSLITPVQLVLCCNWNKCSKPRIISWVSTAWVFTLKHFPTCYLPRISCFYWGERCTDVAAGAGEGRKSGLKCVRRNGEGGGRVSIVV